MRTAISEISISNKSVPGMEIELTSTERKVSTDLYLKTSFIFLSFFLSCFLLTFHDNQVKTAINDTSVSNKSVPAMETKSSSTEVSIDLPHKERFHLSFFLLFFFTFF